MAKMTKRIRRPTTAKRTTVDPRPRYTIWLDRDVIAYYRRTGRGWKLRINAALRKAAKLPAEKQKKA